ncbi:MAG: hypothetical protein ACQETI_11800 [Halobacteriota archaeon]
MYVYPAVLTEFVVGLRPTGTFRTEQVVDAISSSYFVAWVIGFLIQVGSFVALLFFGFIPLVRRSVFVIGSFVGFAANVAAFRAFGVAYRSAASPTTG